MRRKDRVKLPKDTFFQFKFKHHINYFIVLALFAVALILDFTMPRIQSNRDLFVQISYNVILAVSLNIVVGLLGELSLGHAGFMCVGAYIGGYIGNLLLPVIPNKIIVIIIAMIGAGIAAALAGLVIGFPTLRLKGDYLAISTLAFGEIIRNIFKNLPFFGKALGLETTYYGKKLYIIAVVAMFITVVLAQNLQKSPHGRAIQAIRDSEISAKAMGVNATYYKLVAFVIGAFFAGVAGALYANNVSPVRDTTFNVDKSIEILVMVVLGGMGNLTGSILSAASITFINVKLDTILTGDAASIKKILYAAILIAIVIWGNAPALRGLRDRFNITKLWMLFNNKLPHDKRADAEPPSTASWDKIPTKINMDAIISTDLTPDDNNDNSTHDPDRKPEAK